MSERLLAGDKDQGGDGKGRLSASDAEHTRFRPSEGWTSMAAQVQEYDEAKVKDTKEDIDTLLVFVRCGFQAYL